MAKSSPVRVLPAGASLDHLKKEAKRLLVLLKKKKPGMKLAEAQLALAREHGFSSWRVLKARVEVMGVSEEVAKAFLSAVGEGDVGAVREMIDLDGRLVNAIGPHPMWGGRPQGLHVAIEKGHEALFELLLERGADVEGNNTGYAGWSPLQLATHWKRDGMARRLIQKGAKVGFVEAVMLGDDAMVERLLKESPDVIHSPLPGGNGMNALHAARTAKAARMLLERGLSLEAKDAYGRTPLETAAARSPEDAELLAVLSEGGRAHPGVMAAMGDVKGLERAYKADPSCLNGEYVVEMLKLPLLNIAAEKGQAEVVAWLLDHEADIRRGNMNNASALHSAAWGGHVAVAKLLVERGADVNARDDEYRATPMDWAQTALERLNRAGCAQVIDYLESIMSKPVGKTVKKKVKVADWKPIMDAAYMGDAAKIKVLVKGGADPNVLATTNHRHRPLHRAVEQKKTYARTEAHEAAVRALLEAGADPGMRAGYESLTAVALAATGEVRFVPILMERYRPDDVFHACVLGDEKRVKAVLKKNPAQAKAIDENGWSALHYCTNSAMFTLGREKSDALVSIAKMLIAGGADPMATYDFEGQWPIPPLYGCCGRHDNPAVARVLFEAGATPYDNETVYHASDEGHEGALKLIEEFADKKKLAEECSRNLVAQLHWNHQRGMAWLLAHGADVNWQSLDAGETALHKAARNGASAETIALLLAHGAKGDVKNKKGKTAVDLAREAGKKRVVEQLQKAATAESRK